MNEHPINTEWGPGLWEAVETFLVKDSEFARDPGREKFLMTYNPGGYLRRAATASSNEIDNKDAIEVQS